MFETGLRLLAVQKMLEKWYSEGLQEQGEAQTSTPHS
jgi:hypothetical protein